MKFFIPTALRLCALCSVAFVLASCGGGGDAPARSAQHAVPVQRSAASTGNASYAYAVEALYIAYFGRPADSAGLVNFEADLAAANAPTDLPGLLAAYNTNTGVKYLVDSFAGSKESQTLYQGSTTSQFVISLFANVINRYPAPSGSQFWANAIDSGAVTRGNAALSIMVGAITNTTAQGKIDAQLIADKIAISTEFSAKAGTADLIPVYSGAFAAADMRNVLESLSEGTSGIDVDATANLMITELVTPPLRVPESVAIDSNGNLFIAEMDNYVIRKLNLATGVMTVFAGQLGVTGSADGVGSAAQFNMPNGVATDAAGNVYVTDAGNGTVRKITAAGSVSTLAGTPGVIGRVDGVGPAAGFTFSTYDTAGMAVDASGNLYVTDIGSQAIVQITPDGKTSTRWGGISIYCLASSLCSPHGLAISPSGTLYAADSGNDVVRQMYTTGGMTTYAGIVNNPGDTDGSIGVAQLRYPEGLAIDAAGNMYVGDTVSEKIRKITPGGTVSTLAGSGSSGCADGTGSAASFSYPGSLAADQNGNVYVADTFCNTIRRITPAGVVTTIAGKY